MPIANKIIAIFNISFGFWHFSDTWNFWAFTLKSNLFESDFPHFGQYPSLPFNSLPQFEQYIRFPPIHNLTNDINHHTLPLGKFCFAPLSLYIAKIWQSIFRENDRFPHNNDYVDILGQKNNADIIFCFWISAQKHFRRKNPVIRYTKNRLMIYNLVHQSN